MTSASTKRVSAEDASLCERACHKAACAIQFCLQRRGYQESKCIAYIDHYYDCCEAAKGAIHGNDQGDMGRGASSDHISKQ